MTKPITIKGPLNCDDPWTRGAHIASAVEARLRQEEGKRMLKQQQELDGMREVLRRLGVSGQIEKVKLTGQRRMVDSLDLSFILFAGAMLGLLAGWLLFGVWGWGAV